MPIDLLLETLPRLLASLPDRKVDLLGVVNGAIGDRLAREQSAHALPMTLRHRGERLTPEAPAIASPIVTLRVGRIG